MNSAASAVRWSTSDAYYTVIKWRKTGFLFPRSTQDSTAMRQIQIGNVSETVVERSDYPPERLRTILGSETVAVLGYGVQGRGQSLNMKDNGVKVIVGQHEKTKSWDLAAQDGWVPGQT